MERIDEEKFHIAELERRRSLAAAKARQALISSRVKSGKSSSISSSLIPPARYSKTSYTRRKLEPGPGDFKSPGVLNFNKKMNPSFFYRIFLLCIVLLSSVSCSKTVEYPQPQSWQLVYQNDYNGKPVSGSIADLVNSVKKGSPIRISWGGTEADSSSWIEFAEPVFTTIMNDTAVVVQLPLSFIQTHYTDPEKAFLQTNPPAGWRAIMSTTGLYHQFHYDLGSGEISREMYSRTNMSWFALTTPNGNQPVPNLTPENAFKLDSLIER